MTRNYIKEQREIAQAKVDVAEGGLIAMALAPVLLGIIAILCIVTIH